MPTRTLRPGAVCDCGQPAVLVRHSEFICARCDELEKIHFGLSRKKFEDFRPRPDEVRHEIQEAVA